MVIQMKKSEAQCWLKVGDGGTEKLSNGAGEAAKPCAWQGLRSRLLLADGEKQSYILNREGHNIQSVITVEGEFKDYIVPASPISLENS
jgi:hypothetical protein